MINVIYRIRINGFVIVVVFIVVDVILKVKCNLLEIMLIYILINVRQWYFKQVMFFGVLYRVQQVLQSLCVVCFSYVKVCICFECLVYLRCFFVLLVCCEDGGIGYFQGCYRYIYVFRCVLFDVYIIFGVIFF